MKLAVTISGLPRFFIKGYDSLKQHILDKFDCDIYLHTWKKLNDEPFDLVKGTWRYPDEGSLDDYLSLYKPKGVIIEGWTDTHEQYYTDLEQKYNPNTGDRYLRRFLPMWYGVKESFNLAINYGQKFNIKYDYLIRTRPDLVINDFKLPERELTFDHHGSGINPEAPGDCFACGTLPAMNYYSSLCNYFDHYFIHDNHIPHPESSIEHHFKGAGIKYDVSHFVSHVLRPSNWSKNIDR